MNMFRVLYTYLFVVMFFFGSITFFKKDTYQEKTRLIYIFLISILFPSVWFHIGVLAEEQFTLLLALITIFFRKSWTILSLIGFWIASIDLGNFILFLIFYLTYLFYQLLLEQKGYKITFYALLVLISISLYIKMDILKYLEIVPVIGEKAKLIYDHYTEIYSINDKYPLVLRPLITLLSLIFLLPNSKTLFPFTYLFTFVFLFKYIFPKKRIHRIAEKNRSNPNFKIDYCYSITGITMILCIPIIIPGFSNGKYYIFLIPYFFLFANYFTKLNNLFIYVLICNFLVIIQLIAKFII